jgi:hypothetical protein
MHDGITLNDTGLVFLMKEAMSEAISQTQSFADPLHDLINVSSSTFKNASDLLTLTVSSGREREGGVKEKNWVR